MSCPGFDSSDGDIIEHILPYFGGDISGTETGYSYDSLAELNEPFVFDPFHDNGLTEASIETIPLLLGPVFEDSPLYQQPVVSHATEYSNPLSSAPVPSMHHSLYPGSEQGLHGSELPSQASWPDLIPMFSDTIPATVAYYGQPTVSSGHRVQTCSYPASDHPYHCQGHDENMPDPDFEVEEAPDPQVQYDNEFLSPRASDMERGDSSGTFASVASLPSPRQTVSSMIR
ncbi:hypothetical protein SVAN01_08473 [Stagonosporopsis vannaccii]|nr:hypothetical protein SVAN01_08473 [Stagonosporopsis vannaccii]